MRKSDLVRLARRRRRRPLLQIDRLEGRRLLSGSDEIREWTAAFLREQKVDESAEVSSLTHLEMIDQAADEKEAAAAITTSSPIHSTLAANHADTDEADDIAATKSLSIPATNASTHDDHDLTIDPTETDSSSRSPLGNSSPVAESAVFGAIVRIPATSHPGSSLSTDGITLEDRLAVPNPSGQSIPGGSMALAAAELTPGLVDAPPEQTDDPSLLAAFLAMNRDDETLDNDPPVTLRGDGLIESISPFAMGAVEKAIDQILAQFGEVPSLDVLVSPRLFEVGPLSLAIAATVGAIVTARRLRRLDLDSRETRGCTYPELAFVAIPRRT
jgi:hypothetical protein